LLDHILLGCRNLQHGIDFVEKHTGVRATFGGVHPGRGTQNALLSLGTRRYLEIIAPDPQQHGGSHVAELVLQLKEPRIVGWAAHPGDIAALAAKFKQAGIVAEGPTPGSRKRPDGKILHWRTLNLKNDFGGKLPFFIEWGTGTVHPSVDAPVGCIITRFSYAGPDYDGVVRIFHDEMGLDVISEPGEKSQLRATLGGPNGLLSLIS
jgi:hypothetical protein